jgi:hypothetical protein
MGVEHPQDVEIKAGGHCTQFYITFRRVKDEKEQYMFTVDRRSNSRAGYGFRVGGVRERAASQRRNEYGCSG